MSMPQSQQEVGRLLEHYRRLLNACEVGDEETLRDMLAEELPKDLLLMGLLQTIEHDQLFCLRMLLDADAPIDVPGASMLMMAARKGINRGHRHDIMVHLIHHGANLCARDATGRSALHWALRDDNADAVRLLIMAGYDPQDTDVEARSGWDMASEDCASLMRNLLLQDPKIDDHLTCEHVIKGQNQDISGRPMLAMPRHWKNFDRIVRQLAANGDRLRCADLWQTDPVTKKPFIFLAAEYGYLDDVMEFRKSQRSPMRPEEWTRVVRGKSLLDIIATRGELNVFIPQIKWRDRGQAIKFCQNLPGEYRDQVADYCTEMMALQARRSQARRRQHATKPKHR